MSEPRPIVVQKFGGTSLAGAEAFLASAGRIAEHTTEYQVVAVLSAVKGVTDLLQLAIDRAASSENHSEVLDEAMELQRRVLEELAVDRAGLAAQFLTSQAESLEELLEGVRLLGQCPDKVCAQILASGEGFSSRLMTDLLNTRGIEASWHDSSLLPTANDDWLDSLVDIEAAGPKIREIVESTPGVVVLPGFYAANRKGEIQLLGRNGTDYSAASVAAALRAKLCQIWKEVDGFFTADPSVVGSATCLEEVSYDEAMELTFFGSRVISAKALTPLQANDIRCEVRNTFKPEHPGTLVHGDARPGRVVRGISHLPEVTAITLQGGGLRGRVGVARRVMDALARRNISVLLIVQSSSEHSITLCVRAADGGPAVSALEDEFHFERLHGLITEIAVLDDRAVVTLVGDGMKHYRGIAARFLTAISAAGVNVEVIAQGSNECAISVVVQGSDAISATRACHTAFFSNVAHIDVILLGCGNVGSELLRQFQRQVPTLLENHIELRVRAIANSRKLLVSEGAIELGEWTDLLERDGREWGLGDILEIRQELGLLNPTIIDCTTDEGLARHYVEFLSNGFNVVAANKKANTGSMDYYRAMREAAARNFKKFLYETNVGAGLPIVDTVQALIRSGDELRTFEGVLSGSLSMIFGLLDDGLAFSGAVDKAMALGYTEPDPRDDLSGMDVARKLLIIAREVGLELELEDIVVEPVVPLQAVSGVGREHLVGALADLDSEFERRAAEARDQGSVLRYVGRLENGACRVSVETTPLDQPLGAIRDGENALVLHTRYYNPIPLVVRGYGAGAEVTAAGVFADLLRTVWRPLD